MITQRVFKLSAIFILFLITSCGNNSESEYHLLLPGQGYDNFKLGQTTIEDIEKEIGKDYSIDTFYRQRLHDTVPNRKEIYSIGACYDKIGIRFYFFPGEKTIFSISLRPPFKAATKEGIRLNESSFGEIQQKYGETPWGFGKGTISFNYDSIIFTQKSNCTAESNGDSLKKCLDNKVTEITIMKPE